MNRRQQKALSRLPSGDREALKRTFAAENAGRKEERAERREKRELAKISRDEGHPFAALMREIPSPRDREGNAS